MLVFGCGVWGRGVTWMGDGRSPWVIAAERRRHGGDDPAGPRCTAVPTRRESMLKVQSAFSGFSVNDPAKARAFYGETLGLQVTEEGGGLRIQLPGGGTAFAYPKENHQPATYTMLDFVVEN